MFMSGKALDLGHAMLLVTQRKSKTRSVHRKFNCITVNFYRTQHGIYVIDRA